MQYVELRDEAREIIRALAGPVAERYLRDSLLPELSRSSGARSNTIEEVRVALAQPYKGLRAIYHHYAFARRGKERHELAEIAVSALERTATQETFETFLKQPNAAALWENFEVVARDHRKKPMDQLNRGVVAGLAELCQEIYRIDGVGSIAEWVVEAVNACGRIEPEFLRIVDIRGVGPKLSSIILRDIVFLYDLERNVDNADKLYLNPIDKWARLIAPTIIDEPNLEEAADWVLAGKLSKYARVAGVSSVRLNMGMSHYGHKQIRVPENLSRAISDLRATYQRESLSRS